MRGPGVTLSDKLDGMRVARPFGISALSFFFVFGMSMSALATVSLAFPRGVLEPIWKINPRGREALGALGLPAVFLMATVSVACAGAAAGLWLGRLWVGGQPRRSFSSMPRATYSTPFLAAIRER